MEAGSALLLSCISLQQRVAEKAFVTAHVKKKKTVSGTPLGPQTYWNIDLCGNDRRCVIIFLFFSLFLHFVRVCILNNWLYAGPICMCECTVPHPPG